MATLTTSIASHVDIKAMKGDTFSISMVFTDGAGDPVDLTGYSFLMQVKERKDSTTSKLTFTSGSEIEITGDDNNTLLITKDASEMVIRSGGYYYDLQGTDPYGKVLTYIEGHFTIVQDVTRSL